MRYYARNIGDLAAATRGLDLLHRGAYDALLDAYYLRELPLPADARECYLLADARSPAERRAVDFVLTRFFRLEADGYRQKRCDRVLAKYAAKSDKARASAAARWAQCESDANASSEQCERNANASEKPCERNATQYPIPNTQKKPTPPLPAGASPPKSVGSRLPGDWVLPARWGEWAMSERPDLDREAVRRIAASFADHWHAKAGADARKVDWEATWRNWVRREKRMSAKPPDAREARRSASVSDILGAVNHDHEATDHDPRDISGEAVRVA